MTNMHSLAIAYHLLVTYKNQQVTLTGHYKHRGTSFQITTCSKCGSVDHTIRDCRQEKNVCYLCKKDHLQKQCPLNDGTKESDSAVVFLSERSVLSNFNMECPIMINDKTYLCTEQYIQSQKALLFGDTEPAEAIME